MNTRLGHYDIVEELGRGGMGVVYKGYESSLGRYVAIKVLSATMAHDKVFVERFLREARAMATLNDSHIIQIYFIGQDEEQTFFVMEYIDGESLSTCLKREIRLVPSDALKILLHASQGLSAAHAQGVIHRDIKPGNIMITSRGQVKVADFGIALANQDVSDKLTNTGAFVGTPGYLSPEVCLGKSVDQRSDIFALGIVLFEMLSGRMPFNDESPLRLMLDVVQADAPDIRELNPDVDEDVARILNKMLAKDPADRYQSCDELNADLKRHPLVVQDGQLKLRPAPWAGANASNPTVVGMPTPATPGHVPRASTPPPVVSSGRTPTQTHAAAPITAAASAPKAGMSTGTRSVLLLVGVLTIAVLGWAIGRTGPEKVGSVASVPTAGAAVPAPTPPTPPAVPGAEAPADAATADAAALAAGAKPIATDAAGDANAEAVQAVATVRYGHGGANTKLNRVRARAVHEPTPEEIAREEARQQNLAAALAATEAQAALPEPVAPAQNQQADPKVKRSFLCRVFKKCDPPKKRDESKPAAGTAGG
jgi:serine/threonine-protein kinase